MNESEHNLNIESEKYYLTMATLVTPYAKESIGRSCDWFKTDGSKQLNESRSFMKVKFENGHSLHSPDLYLVSTDRDECNGSKFPQEIHRRDVDFAQFAAEQKGQSKIFWEFFLAKNKLKEIEENSEKGSRIQLFDICFDKAVQRDKDLLIFSSKPQPSGLIFRSKINQLMGLGIVERHSSMTVKKYENITGEDPILLFARKNYHDPVYSDKYTNKETFEEYLAQQRSIFN